MPHPSEDVLRATAEKVTSSLDDTVFELAVHLFKAKGDYSQAAAREAIWGAIRFLDAFYDVLMRSAEESKEEPAT